MRSITWLTTLTLLASAIGTVAIVDYGRRHPESTLGQFFASLQSEPAMPAPGAAQIVGIEPPKTDPDDMENMPQVLKDAQILSTAKPPEPAMPPPTPANEFAIEREENPVRPSISAAIECESLVEPAGHTAMKTEMPTSGAKGLASLIPMPTKPKNSISIGLSFGKDDSSKAADGKPALTAAITFRLQTEADEACREGCRPACDPSAVEACTTCCQPAVAQKDECKTCVRCEAPKCADAVPSEPKVICVEATPAIVAKTLYTRFYQVDDLITEAQGHLELLDVVQRMVAPETWQRNGGPGEIAYYTQGRTLIVRQSAEIAEQLEGFLSKMREQLAEHRREEPPLWISHQIKPASMAMPAEVGAPMIMEIDIEGVMDSWHWVMYDPHAAFDPSEEANLTVPADLRTRGVQDFEWPVPPWDVIDYAPSMPAFTSPLIEDSSWVDAEQLRNEECARRLLPFRTFSKELVP